MLTIGSSSYKTDKNDEKVKAPIFILFGQPIHIEQENSNGCFSDESSQVNRSSDESANEIPWDHVGLCEVFLESENVGRTLDLSVIGSYEELRRTLANWFGIERFDNLTHVLYRDFAGAIKRVGDEPFRYPYYLISYITYMIN